MITFHCRMTMFKKVELAEMQPSNRNQGLMPSLVPLWIIRKCYEIDHNMAAKCQEQELKTKMPRVPCVIVAFSLASPITWCLGVRRYLG